MKIDFEKIVGNLGDGVLIVDIETLKLVYANEMFCKLTGYSPAEVLKKTVSDIHPKKNLPYVMEQFKKQFEKQSVLAKDIPVLKKDGSVVLCDISAVPMGIEEKKYNVGVFHDLTAHKKDLANLAVSELRYRRLFETAQDGILILDAATGLIVDVNPFLVDMLGFTREEFRNKKVWEIGLFKDKISNEANFRELQRKKYIRYEDMPLETKNGRHINVEFVSNAYQVDQQEVIQCNIRDISERKNHEILQLLSRHCLSLLNNSEDVAYLIRDILLAVKNGTGIEAVGIRLENNEDFPYYETKGFPDDFLKKEFSLCCRDAAGKILRDERGETVLECMCGNVIRGRTDTKLPFFTEQGSFWTNSTTGLLASTTESECQSHTRNQCNKAGYESVALIPLRTSNKILGLLQLNDRRSGQFVIETITFLEGLGESISIALHRKQTEAELNRKVRDLEIFNKAAVERELKMIELKKRIEELESEKKGKYQKGIADDKKN